MKKISALVIFLVAAAVAPAAEPGFWRQLTPDERRAAGVDQLTPDQQQALDSLAARFAANASREVRAEAKQEARAEVRRELDAEAKTKAIAQAGLPAPVDQSVVRTRIVGKTNGWSGRTIFRLENGQIWVQTDSKDSFWMPAAENPDVELRPASLGGWKLFLTGRDAWVHVRRVQ